MNNKVINGKFGDIEIVNKKIIKKSILNKYSKNELEIYKNILTKLKINYWCKIKGLKYLPLPVFYNFLIQDNNVNIITNYYGKTLENFTNKLNNKNIQIIINELLNGLEYLHHNNIVHNDIKPTNILIKDFKTLQRITLIDFNLSCANNTRITNFIGNKMFCSTDNHKLFNLTFKNDLESLCYLFYYLLFKSLPWKKNILLSKLKFKKDILQNKFNFDYVNLFKCIFNLNKYDYIDYNKYKKMLFNQI